MCEATEQSVGTAPEPEAEERVVERLGEREGAGRGGKARGPRAGGAGSETRSCRHRCATPECRPDTRRERRVSCDDHS